MLQALVELINASLSLRFIRDTPQFRTALIFHEIRVAGQLKMDTT